MKKLSTGILFLLLVALTLSGCSSIGDKATNMSAIYGVTMVLSFALLIGYCSFIKKKDVWFILLFASVFIVNTGYLTLSISRTLEEALLANRIAYLGSALLPYSMLMIILNFSGLKYKKYAPGILLAVSTVVFFVAASPGYLDIYYKSVTLEHIGGVSVLNKEYGAWHCIYLYYLLSYFTCMIAIILHAAHKKKLQSGAHAAILLIAVFVNICVWLLEQLVKIDFEFLSVSYIISELFLLGLYLMIQDSEKNVTEALPLQAEELPSDAPNQPETEEMPTSYLEQCRYLEAHVADLTATEHTIYDCYLAGKSTKDIMKELNITENTLKFHNKNIYSKLGVTSRKQMLEYVKVLKEISEKEEKKE
ncbi:MAG: hypothetical protein IJC78_07185 [Clostridia bacterium]|nr:hypothetical protein [Clostridia bacterium]